MNQTWKANNYVEHAGFVPVQGMSVFKLLNPKASEHILDLGCGDGLLTLQIQNAGASVLGIDSSAAMIELALKRGLSAQMMSGESIEFENEFDAVFSNAALHWMKNYQAVIAGVYAALKMGGRFVGEFGGAGNVSTIVKAMEQVFSSNPEFGEFNNPWFYPHPNDYQKYLEAEGFRVDHIELIPRPTPLKSGVREWLNIFANGITQTLTVAQKSLFLDQVEALLKPKLFLNDEWVADYVRLRFCAVKV